MIVVMNSDATQADIANAKQVLSEFCGDVHVSVGANLAILGLIGLQVDHNRVEAVASRLPGVNRTERITHEYKLVGARSIPSEVRIGQAPFGAGSFSVIAGPCAVESYELTLAIAKLVQAAGASVLRGDFVKARTSPYAWEGLGEEGLRILARVKELTGLPFVVDVLSTADVELALAYGADCLRVGTRYMYSAGLLEAVGRQSQASVMLKRGFSATLTEWLLQAERIAMQGNSDIILVERGIRSFGEETRNLLDIMATATLRQLTHLPIIIDPSHSTGKRSLVASAARVAVAAPADGLMIDVHPSPESALVDGSQALLPPQFESVMGEVSALASALGLKLT